MRVFLAWVFLAACGSEPVEVTCHADEDRDGYGDPDRVVDCSLLAVVDASDCAPDDPFVSPSGVEVCNQRDDDCDVEIDEEAVDGVPFFTDGDGDGWGTDLVTACAVGPGLAFADGDCDDGNPNRFPGAVELCDDIDDDCDGVDLDGLGTSPACPVASCLDAVDPGGSIDGSYFLTLPSGKVLPVWCDQTTSGGGWTQALLRNSTSTGSQGDFGASEVAPEQLATSPSDASASATPVQAWLDLNTFPYTELRLGAWKQGNPTYLSRSIPRSELRIAFGEDGYFLYGGVTGYFWCGGDASYTDGGVGAVNNPADAPPGCKQHGGLGSGWDFSESNDYNYGLTLCGGDASAALTASWGRDWLAYGTPGGAYVIWVR